MTVRLGSTGVYSCWFFGNSRGLSLPEVICTLLIFGALFGERSIFPVVLADNHHVLCVSQSQKCPFIRSCSSIVRNFCKVVISCVFILHCKPHPLFKPHYIYIFFLK